MLSVEHYKLRIHKIFKCLFSSLHILIPECLLIRTASLSVDRKKYFTHITFIENVMFFTVIRQNQIQVKT